MMVSTIAMLLLTAAPAAGASASCPPASLQIRVTDREGKPLTAVHVIVQGAAPREGTTNVAGCISFGNMRAGTYMLRAERESFITLEKEFTVSAGRVTVVSASLSPAPARTIAPGLLANTKVLSIPDLAERHLIGREAVKESPIGCSGATDARLIQIREPLAIHAHREADETLYVVAGQGTLKIGDEEQRVAPGWFSIIPHGAAHSLVRTGKNPLIVVSTLNGQPCARTVAVARAGADRH